MAPHRPEFVGIAVVGRGCLPQTAIGYRSFSIETDAHLIRFISDGNNTVTYIRCWRQCSLYGVTGKSMAWLSQFPTSRADAGPHVICQRRNIPTLDRMTPT